MISSNILDELAARIISARIDEYHGWNEMLRSHYVDCEDCTEYVRCHDFDLLRDKHHHAHEMLQRAYRSHGVSGVS